MKKITLYGHAKILLWFVPGASLINVQKNKYQKVLLNWKWESREEDVKSIEINSQ